MKKLLNKIRITFNKIRFGKSGNIEIQCTPKEVITHINLPQIDGVFMVTIDDRCFVPTLSPVDKGWRLVVPMRFNVSEIIRSTEDVEVLDYYKQDRRLLLDVFRAIVGTEIQSTEVRVLVDDESICEVIESVKEDVCDGLRTLAFSPREALEKKEDDFIGKLDFI